MINHELVLLALRDKLAELDVATTGLANITATDTGYTRTSGDFQADGLAPGMELVGSGFGIQANNTAKVITEVTELEVLAEGCVAEAVGSRVLSVGLPEDVASENTSFTPTTGKPYFQEEYLPGGAGRQVTLGTLAELEMLPAYVVKVYVPANTAVLAVHRYVTALLALFAPGTALAVSGHTVTVRRDVMPFPSQLLRIEGYAVVTVTVPLRVRTANAI